jgi:hypothetical protein
MLTATTIAIPPGLKFAKEVMHGDPKTLHYDLVDMRKITPKI